MVRPKKILFIHHFSGLGGAERFLVSVWKNLDKEFEAVFLNQEAGELSEEAGKLGLPVYALPMKGWRKSKYMLHNFFTARKLDRLCRELKIDGICSGCYRVTPYAVKVAARRKIPCLTILQDLAESDKLDKFRVFACDRLVAVSKCVADSARGRYSGEIDVVYNGIDCAEFRPAGGKSTLRAELGIPEGSPVVGMIAHIVPWKGHRVFLRAMQEVNRGCPEACFVIVGESLYKHELDVGQLKEEAVRLGIDRHVIFVGGRKDIARVLRGMDIFVHPADREPFGRVVIEAMASGLPVVATRCGGPEEIITHGQTGLLVEKGDAPAIAAETLRLLRDDKLRGRLGLAARERARDEFSVEKTGRSINDVFRKWLG